MTTILHTDRLILRQFTTEDAGFMLKLVNEPSWLEYIGDRNVHSLEDAEQYLLNGSIKSYAENGFGFYAVVLKENGLSIGSCGLAKRPFLDHPDIGFALLPGYTGKGYAFEIAEATMKFAIETLGLRKISAITTPDNIRSIKLLGKIGLQFEKTIDLDGDKLNLYLMELK